MKRLAALALACTALAVPAQAEGSSDICPEVADDARGRACIRSLLAHEEQGLATVWRNTFAFFGGSRLASGRALLAEQRAWIVFKDKACGLYFLPELSAMEWSNGQRCKMRIIRSRVIELDAMQRDFPGIQLPPGQD